MQLAGGDLIIAVGDATGATGIHIVNAGSGDFVGIKFDPDSAAVSNLFAEFALVNTYGVAVNSALSLIAVGQGATPYVRLIDVSSENVLGNPSTLPAGAARILAFNAAGTRLAVPHSNTPYITIYNTSDWSKLTNPSTLPAGNALTCSFNYAGTILAVGNFGNPSLTLYNTGDYSKISNPATVWTTRVTDVSFSPNDSFLAVSGYTSPYLLVYNTSDWSTVTLTDSPSALWAERVEFSPGGTYLAACGWYTPFFMVYSVGGWTRITGLPAITSRAYGIKWIDNTTLAVTYARYILVIDVVAKTVLSKKIMPYSNAEYLSGVVGQKSILSGTVRDVNENGLARSVRAVHAGSGRLHAETVSESVTGVFAMTVFNDEKYNVMCDGESGELSEIIDAAGV